MNFGSNGGSSKYTLQPGTYPATISKMVGIGIQKNEYEGEIKYPNQCIIEWTTDEKTEENERLTVWSFLAISLHEKSTMLKMIKGVSEKTIDADAIARIEESQCLGHLVGRSALINVEHTSGGNAKVTGYSRMIASITPPEVEEDNRVYFDFDLWLEAGADAVPEVPKHFLKFIARAENCPIEIMENIGAIVAESNQDKPQEITSDIVDDPGEIPF